MVDALGLAEDHVTLHACGVKKSHHTKGIALTYRTTVNQRAVCREAVFCRNVVNNVSANVIVNGRKLFQIALVRKVKERQDLGDGGVDQFLLCRGQIIFRTVGNGVIVDTVLGVLGGRRAVALDGKGIVAVKLCLGLAEPAGQGVTRYQTVCLDVEGLGVGASLLQGLLKGADKIVLIVQIYLVVRGRNRAEVAHIKDVFSLYRIALIVDGLIGGEGDGGGKIHLLGLLHKGEGGKGSGSIAFGDAVAVGHEGVLSCRLIVVDRYLVGGRKASLNHGYQLKGVRVVLDTVLHTPDTGVAVDTDGDVQIIVVFLGLNGQIFLNRAVVCTHGLGNRRCLGQSNLDGLVMLSVTGGYRVEFQTHGKVGGGDTVTAHRLVQAVAINDDLIQRTAVIATVSIVVSVVAGIDIHRRRIQMTKRVVRAVVRPGIEIIHDRSVIGIGIGSVGAGKRKVHGVCEITKAFDPALERESNRKLLRLTLVYGSLCRVLDIAIFRAVYPDADLILVISDLATLCLAQVYMAQCPGLHIYRAELLIAGFVFIGNVIQFVFACGTTVDVCQLNVYFATEIRTCSGFRLSMEVEPVLNRLEIVRRSLADSYRTRQNGRIVIIFVTVYAEPNLIGSCSHVCKACRRLPISYCVSATVLKTIHRGTFTLKGRSRGHGNVRIDAFYHQVSVQSS